MQARISQRQGLACRECTRRKRKCDKKIPCARCTTLGLICDRETILLRRNVNRNGPEIEFLTSIQKELQSCQPKNVARVTQRISERIDHLKSGHIAPARSDKSPNATFEETNDQRSRFELDQFADSGEQPSSIVTSLEHVAWGRSNDNCYPHYRCSCQHSIKRHENHATSSDTISSGRWESTAVVDLPDPKVAERLVQFHISHIAWHHNGIHGPTFLQQCEKYWETGYCDTPHWLALYSAILATSTLCLQNSQKYQYQAGVSLLTHSAQALFDTMIDILFKNQFLHHVSLYSIQAIVISTEVAHTLGLSQLNATLFSAAIRMAECLGLHKIEVSDDAEELRGETWNETIQKELGRRVWLQMVIQDHFAIPFTDSYGINPAHYSTSFPNNAEDADLVAMPDDIPTITTYTRTLGTLAQLMPELADGMGPLKARKSAVQQYQHVLDIDMKMRDVVRSMPRFLLQQDQILEAQIPWLRIARQSLAISAAEKIIMVHRPFIFQSFKSASYNYTRRTCVSAAMTALREHTSITESGELSLWTHTAFCLTAILVLCFEVMSGKEDSEERLNGYSDQIIAARGRLATRESDILAQRGVALIDEIWPHVVDAQKVSISMDFEQTVASVMANCAILGSKLDSGLFDGQDISGLRERLEEPCEDFDAWFEQVFSATSDVLQLRHK